MNDIYLSLIINLSSGIIIFLLGLFWPVIPKSYRGVKLRKFWSKHVVGRDFVIAFGALKDSRLAQPSLPCPPQTRCRNFRYVKTYHNGNTISLVGPWSNVVSECEIRSASYIINTLSAYRKTPVIVMDDTTAYTTLDRTFVSLGSPSSNEITNLVIRDPENKYLEFAQPGSVTIIRDKINGRQFVGFQPPYIKDYGMILKIPNTRFPGHYFFVCAGLGEWGTSGASWYLATKWRELKKIFGDAFGVVVEVEIGSDESAKRVFP